MIRTLFFNRNRCMASTPSHTTSSSLSPTSRMNPQHSMELRNDGHLTKRLRYQLDQIISPILVCGKPITSFINRLVVLPFGYYIQLTSATTSSNMMDISPSPAADETLEDVANWFITPTSNDANTGLWSLLTKFSLQPGRNTS